MNNIIDKLIKLAKKSAKNKEIPVSSIILDKNNKIIAYGINNRQNKNNVLGHAEINAILKAEKKINDWRLDGYKMFVTLMPCEMCQNIIKECRLDDVNYLLDRDKTNKIINNIHKIDNIEKEKEYEEILSDFFKKKR